MIRRALPLTAAALLASGCALLVGIEDHRLAASTATTTTTTTTSNGGGGAGGTTPGTCPPPDLGTTECSPGLADCDDDSVCGNALASDPQHCGACGHDCLGGACEASVCQQVALTPAYNVTEHFGPMTVFEGKVYYAAGPHDANVIYSVPVEGGTPVKVSGGAVGQVYQIAIAKDAVGSLLVANAYFLGEWVMQGMLSKGGTPMPLTGLDDYTTGLAVGPSGLIVVSELHTIKAIAVATPDTIVQSTDPIRAMAIDNENVYWVTHPDSGTGKGEVVRATLLGNNRTTLASGLGQPGHLALDDTSVYWTDSALGTVSRAPKAGGVPEVLVSDQKAPGNVAVAGDDLFWSDDDGLFRAKLCDLGAGRVQLTNVSTGAVMTSGKRAFATDTHFHQVSVFAR